jgi:hypothetical protein
MASTTAKRTQFIYPEAELKHAEQIGQWIGRVAARDAIDNGNPKRFAPTDTKDVDCAAELGFNQDSDAWQVIVLRARQTYDDILYDHERESKRTR